MFSEYVNRALQDATYELIEDGTYPGLEAGIEEAIENQELMNEEEMAGQMAIENQQQKMLPAPKARGMEGQTNGKEVTRDSVVPFGMTSLLDRLAKGWPADPV